MSLYDLVSARLLSPWRKRDEFCHPEFYPESGPNRLDALSTHRITGSAGMSFVPIAANSLSDLKNRSEKVTGRGQILTISKANSYSIDQKSGEIWTGQTLLQLISFKSDRLVDHSFS